MVLLCAKTQLESGEDKISILLVEGDAVGFKRGRNLDKIGRDAQDTSELFFEDVRAVSYTHLRAHETLRYLVCRLLLEKKK